MRKERWIPSPTPETSHFWEGTRIGLLRLQKCDDCSHVYFPPRPVCRKCGCSNVSIVEACGKAILASYVISHLPVPGFESPYVVAIVELEEGPRMLTNLIGVDASPTSMELGMDLEVVYSRLNDTIALPLFKPSGNNQ
ncbi:Zn-ribbon domain-containing OB-fold protein [Bradyrhizobium sp. AUGA SZCCT0431]|uniref:Zn-ribbon domain-containing OB-fold protein n=1 Tax=Bradyrhizobium sp. AUGA SZCCT0431 TaxID=2807674 RepID=UPI001BA4B655|nr:Zn-ribbon domain-containing OB-fold protein [Bradyrhizobium sp. AUGA SZCCT0431]